MAKMMMNEKALYGEAVAYDYDIMREFTAAALVYVRNGCKNVRICCPELGYIGNGVTADAYYSLDYSDYDVIRDLFGGYLNVMLVESIPAYDNSTYGGDFYYVRGF